MTLRNSIKKLIYFFYSKTIKTTNKKYNENDL